MSELAKCRCGAEATLNSPCVRGEAPFTHFVDCERCGSSGPNEDSPAEAIAAWNALMRPRPVAEWTEATDSAALWCGELCLGRVRLVDGRGWTALCCVTGDRPSGHALLRTEDSARAWLEERVRAAGFEVREESSRA